MAAHMERPAGVKADGVESMVSTRLNHDTQPPLRLQAVSRAIVAGLRILPAAGNPGYPSLGAIAAGLAAVFRARLGGCERLCIASAALMSLDAETAEQLAKAALHDVRAGSPVPPLQDLRDEARYWAGLASPAERRAYLSAIWNHTPETERVGFLRAVRPAKRRAAA